MASLAWKKLSKLFGFFADQGVNWVMASGAPAKGMHAFLVTGGGSGTDVVTFASKQEEGETLCDMATASYVVLVHGEFAGSVRIDESTKATTGFSILGLGLNEVANVIVIGRLSSMPSAI